MTTLKRPINEAQLKANRANAKKSTGPRTIEGKARSSLNALTHGLTATDHTALGEDRNRLPNLLQSFLVSWNPQTPYEVTLLENLASLQIRLSRCVRMETGLLDMDMPEVVPADPPETINSATAQAFVTHEGSFMNYSRYEANLSRAYDRTLKQILAVRKEGLQPVTAEPAATFAPTLVPAPIATPAPTPDETNPIPVENNAPPPAPEDRRTGKRTPIRKRQRPPATLIWTFGDETDRPHPMMNPTEPTPNQQP